MSIFVIPFWIVCVKDYVFVAFFLNRRFHRDMKHIVTSLSQVVEDVPAKRGLTITCITEYADEISWLHTHRRQSRNVDIARILPLVVYIDDILRVILHYDRSFGVAYISVCQHLS